MKNQMSVYERIRGALERSVGAADDLTVLRRTAAAVQVGAIVNISEEVTGALSRCERASLEGAKP